MTDYTDDRLQHLALAILGEASTLDGVTLDRVMAHLGQDSWEAVVGRLQFAVVDTGGGLGMLAAPLGGDHWVGLTDGEADLPESAECFYLGVMEYADDSEVYSLCVQAGGVRERGGAFLEGGG